MWIGLKIKIKGWRTVKNGSFVGVDISREETNIKKNMLNDSIIEEIGEGSWLGEK